jgi:hypothetical protein
MRYGSAPHVTPVTTLCHTRHCPCVAQVRAVEEGQPIRVQQLAVQHALAAGPPLAHIANLADGLLGEGGESLSLNEAVERLLDSGVTVERELQQLLPRAGAAARGVHALAAAAHETAFKRACAALARAAPAAAPSSPRGDGASLVRALPACAEVSVLGWTYILIYLYIYLYMNGYILRPTAASEQVPSAIGACAPQATYILI